MREKLVEFLLSAFSPTELVGVLSEAMGRDMQPDVLAGTYTVREFTEHAAGKLWAEKTWSTARFWSVLQAHRPDRAGEIRALRADLLATPLDSLPDAAAATIQEWLRQVQSSRRFTHLPPMLGDDAPLPMASMYVELRIAGSTRPSRRHQLVPSFSLAQEQQALYQRRRALRLRVSDAFDSGIRPLHAVVLGDPGGGKTSMLKRMVLDIAAGEMRQWRVPLFASLADWWRARQHSATGRLSVMRFLCKALVSARTSTSSSLALSVLDGPRFNHREGEVVALAEHLLERADGGRGDVLLLLDGFDEIATEPAAVEAVLAELERLTPRLSWVMTSRRAGFDGRIPARERYELAELDTQGIHRLVRNWFQHHPDPEDPGVLLDGLAPGKPIRLMAHNPFLLSLMCRIHQDRGGDGDLPETRVGVYREVFALARRQLDARYPGLRSVHVAAERCLARFCRWLYDTAPHAPRQLFDREDWAAFLSGRDSAVGPDALDAHLLPSRLLDRWGEHGDYHLVHLTLHEYLVARDVVGERPELLVEKRDVPAWQEVLRFGASMAWQSDRRAAVRSLLVALLEPPDLNGIRYIQAARILAELPLRDTTTLLGWDLRLRLWDVWREDAAYVSRAAADALALLDPDWGTDRAIAVLNGELSLSVGDGETELYRLLSALGTMQSPLEDPRHAAVQLLGQMDTPLAEAVLMAVLEADSEPALAGRAAEVLAGIDSPDLRARFIAWAAAPERTVPQQVVATLGARWDRDPAWVPWLLVCLEEGDAVLQERAVGALLAIGDSRAAGPLIRRLETNPAALEDDTWALEALGAVGGEEAEAWLAGCWDLAMDEEGIELAIVGALVRVLAVRDMLPDALLASLIALTVDEEDCGDVLEEILYAVQDRAEQGIPTDDELIAGVQGCLTGPAGGIAADALCSIAMQQATDLGQTGLLPEVIRCLSHDDADVRASGASAAGVIGCAGVSAVRRAAPRVRGLAADPDQPDHVRSAAVGALGLWSVQDATTEALLEQLVTGAFDAGVDLRASAAEALGNLSPGRLGRWRSQPLVRRALAKVAAERGIMVFDEGFVDVTGQFQSWPEG